MKIKRVVRKKSKCNGRSKSKSKSKDKGKGSVVAGLKSWASIEEMQIPSG
jgi:hypothetical protein